MGLFGRMRGKRGKGAVVASAPTDSQLGRDFQVLDGRQHMADAPYMLPRDDQEINRLDFQHYRLRYALRSNYAAPIGRPRSILDVGCGTGRWALEMATLEGLRGPVASRCVTSAAAFDEAVAGAKAEIAQGGCACPMYVVYGQRPA